MAKKKCENCGKEFEPKEEKHRFCSSECYNQASGGSRTSQHPYSKPGKRNISTDFRFNSEYLKNGYFENKRDKNYLRAEYLDQISEDIAKLLAIDEMKSHQMRRFFNKARGIQVRYKREHDFEAIKADIYSFKADVVYAVGRKVVPDDFKKFIDKNVDLAVLNEANFQQGFLRHFENVLAYFVYYTRE